MPYGQSCISLERLKLLSDGRLLYRLKKQWRDGTSHIIFQPHELMNGWLRWFPRLVLI
jgi:hypothetical protein